MTALKCEACGAGLSMDANSEFVVCDYCGMKYTKDWVKAKIQEIKGTVAVSNIASLESLMKRGMLALEASDWKQANKHFDRVLDIDPEYAQAYVGKLCAEAKACRGESLADSEMPLSELSSFKNATRFSDTKTSLRLKDYDSEIIERIREKKDAEQRETQRNTWYCCLGCLGFVVLIFVIGFISTCFTK
jgi:DNA-directed RNA polymerase subunit RPC12/RpoP